MTITFLCTTCVCWRGRKRVI